MIKMTEIEKYYSSGFVKTFVLRGIDLEVEEGEFQISVGGRQPVLKERSSTDIQVAIIKVENPK